MGDTDNESQLISLGVPRILVRIFNRICSGMGLGPSSDATAVAPSDSTALSPVPRALYVGGTGDVTITTPAGHDVTFSSVPAGTILPVQAVKVKATGTTATGIVSML